MRAELEEIVRRLTAEHKWELNAKIDVTPNRMLGAVENGAVYGALRCQRGHANGDWSANRNGLSYLEKRKREDKIKEGFVLLHDTDGKLAAVETIEVVMANLRNEEAEIGRFGWFYWLDTTFKSVAYRGGTPHPDEPTQF